MSVCTKVQCRKCGKATYLGCGEHVEEALFGTALSERCICGEKKSDETSFLSKLFKN